MNNMQRNPFFLPSGFEPQEIINILEAKRDNKKRLDKIKERKRAEKKIIKQAKHNNEHKLCDKIVPYIKNGFKHFTVVEAKEKTDQIQRGYDLAKEWGWDGINRPYTPKIMSVFGGSKRKHR